jgi:hypothetical protein
MMWRDHRYDLPRGNDTSEVVASVLLILLVFLLIVAAHYGAEQFDRFMEWLTRR